VVPADTAFEVGVTETVIGIGGCEALLSPPQLLSAGVRATASHGMVKRRMRFVHELP